jgi:hypothetical protein
MFATLSRDKAKGKDEVKEDSVSEVSAADPMWSHRTTCELILGAEEKGPVVVLARDTAVKETRRAEMDRP